MSQAILCFDYGVKNIGVAFGQSLLATSRELPPLRARDGVPDWAKVEALITQWQPGLLLVGDPLNMDGTASELCGRARKFAKRLHGRFGLPAEMIDERLSTFAAKEEARARGHKGNYAVAPIDSIAARLLLESYFSR